MIHAKYASQSRHLQQGVSLVSLMAGMVVSLLSVLAILSVHQNIRLVSADTQASLDHDGPISGSLLVAEKYVMNAGYGIVDAGLSDIKSATSARSSTTSNDATISLLWRYKEGTDTKCAGLRESGTTIGGKPYRILHVREAASGCALAADIATLNYDTVTATLGQWAVTSEIDAYLDSAANNTLFDFEISELSCSPFGYGVAEDHISVKISVPGTVEIYNTITAGGNQTQLCLSNFYP